MKRLIAVLIASIFFCPQIVHAELSGWHEFDAGVSLAAETEKPMVIFFESPGCYTCEDLKATLQRDVVLEKLVNFVPIHVMGYTPERTYHFQGADWSMRDLMKRFKVRARPALLFLTSSGDKITLFRGEVGRKRLCQILDSVYAQAKAMSVNDDETPSS